MKTPSQPTRSRIAIVGVSALFPGSLEATGFWRDILAGRDMMSDVPESHWLVEDYYDPDPSVPDKTYAKRGAFIDDVDFDAMAWGVPPSIVPETDTSQLLALIVAQQVLEDAARDRIDEIDRSRISVILGVTSGQQLLGDMVSRLQRPVWLKALRESGIPEDEANDVCERIAAQYTPWNESNFPGLLGNVVAGRIANRLDLGGTNCVTDAACASTFSALSMAVQELQLGESDMVISGGVDTINDIFMFMCFSKTPALSPTGDCRPFSDQADGTMLGEGLGMVALKRLEDAERDGNRIYAVINGIGASSDGRAKSVYAPRPEGQARALRRAYEKTGYGPETVELIEAHGTGTVAGDAAEFSGLTAAFDESGRADRQWCALGSVKSQIGHTKAAAGAAGLFKAVMALHHKVLPPTIKVDRPNPALKLEESPFHLSTRSRPWVRTGDHPRRASVSAFGFGGSNFHVALSEYAQENGGGRRAERLPTNKRHLVVLGGADPAAVVSEARQLATRAGSAASGFTAWCARDSQSRFQALLASGDTGARLAVLASDEAELATKLGDAADSIQAEPATGFSTPTGLFYGFGEAGRSEQVAFIFPGQGSQYLYMGADLAMHFGAASAVWDFAADAEGERRTSKAVFPPTAFDKDEGERQAGRLASTECAQPAIGTVSLSMLALLDRLGLEPGHTGGHSYGEIAALHAAGVLDRDDFLQVSRRRGRLMADAATADGAMVAVVESIEVIGERLTAWDVDLVVANHNGARQVVLSGALDQIEKAEKAMTGERLAHRRLPVATAFHSSIVAGAGQAFGEFLEDIEFRAPRCSVYSNVSGAAHDSDPQAMRGALTEQLVSPVRFVEMIDSMYEAGARTFIEVGPGMVTSGLVGGILGDRPHTAISLDRKGKNGVDSFLSALGVLSALGFALDFNALWSEFADVSNPEDKPQPKVTIPINGSNYGRPYPPPGGAADLPAPNPPRTRAEPLVALVSPTDPVTASAPSSPIAPSAVPGPVTVAQSPMAADLTMQSHVPQTAPAATAAWASTYQDAQRQTADAHSVYLKTMADTHALFLESMERSIASATMTVGATAAPPPAPQKLMQRAPAQQSAMPPAVQPPIAAMPAAPAQQAAMPAVPPPIVAMPAAPAQQAAMPAVPPPIVAMPSAPAEVPAIDLQALMLDVVSDKTGYPTGMLTLEMELEGDLGIDSIKRVEILSTMTDRAPGLPEVDTTVMAKLVTLGQVVDYMQEQLAGAVSAASASTVGAPTSETSVTPAEVPVIDLQALMLDVVSDKTGYPTEMLTLEMELEGDLGIDSIKRVEILSTMTDRAPGLPEVDTTVMAKLATLGQVVDYMQEQLAGAVPAASVSTIGAPTSETSVPPAEAPAIDLQALMLEVVAEKTGYPTEMLTLEMELEGDLGIDSIKRVEILSTMTDRAPGLPEVSTTVMAKLETVGQVVDYMNQQLGGRGAGADKVEEATDSAALVSLHEGEDRTRKLGRYVLDAVKQPARGLAQSGVYGPGPVWIAGDGTTLAPELAKALSERGIEAVAFDQLPDVDRSSPRGLIFLSGEPDTTEIEAAVAVNRRAFEAAKKLAPVLEGLPTGEGLFVTVQDTGGAFGTSDFDGVRAWSAGPAALARTAAQEWPGVAVKAIDLERGSRSSEELAQILAEELTAGGPDLDVGLAVDGSRRVLQSREVEVEAGTPVLVEGDVVVCSGGARGVTAAAMIDLAGRVRLRFALLGRSRMRDEPECCRGIEQDAELKRALLARAQERGEKPTPAFIGAEVAAVTAAREIRATLAAIEAAGSQARYVAVDVTDAAAIRDTLDELRTEWGGIAAIVHGAGVLADKKISDKTTEQFDRVFDTKIKGLRSLLEATAADSLKLISLFSSVAARRGNLGQCDYAMANEVLNKVAVAESRRRNGDCLVRAFGWGPWEGGMVSPQLKARFEAMGVALIPLDEGARMFGDECSNSQREQIELVLGDRPRPEALLAEDETRSLSVDVTVGRNTHPYLEDHAIAGVPVVPVTLAIEWFARTARAFRPELQFGGLRDVDVLRGIPLPNFDDAATTLVVRCHETKSTNANGATTLQLQLGDGNGTTYYRCSADLAAQRGRPDVQLLSDAELSFEAWKGKAMYDGDVLFHGPEFQMLQNIHGISDHGIAAALTGVLEPGWASKTVEPFQVEPWCTDPLMFDGGLQLALLWCERVLGGASLPTSIAQVRTFDDPSRGPFRCTLQGRSAAGDRSVSDAVFHDADGRIVAELGGIQTHLLRRTNGTQG